MRSASSRTGGAPTLAVGLANIMQGLIGGRAMMSFWYHFAILFEALFILTAVDAGTRAGRFMLQDLLGNFVPAMRKTESWGANLVGTAGCVALWGYFLYQGVTDPLGGINMLWPLFGIANQMLAGIALMLCTVVLFKMKKDRYAWVPILPTVWLFLKTYVLVFIFFWIRATLPRFRYDQLMQLGWKRLIPGAVLWLILSTVVIGFRQFGAPWS